MKSQSLIYFAVVIFLRLIQSLRLSKADVDETELFKVYQVYPNTNEQLEYLKFLQTTNLTLKVCI